MKLPRDLSGEKMVKHLCRHWEYRQVHQVGSHVILETNSPGHQRIAVPEHHPLRVGTLNAILAAGCRATAPIELQLEGLVGLPNQVQPRYACLGLGGDVDRFEKLHLNIVDALSRVIGLPEGTLYHPLVMLGRLRQEAEQTRVALGRGMRVMAPPHLGSFTLDAVHLLRATAAEGVSSVVEQAYPLGPNV